MVKTNRTRGGGVLPYKTNIHKQECLNKTHCQIKENIIRRLKHNNDLQLMLNSGEREQVNKTPRNIINGTVLKNNT